MKPLIETRKTKDTIERKDTKPKIGLVSFPLKLKHS